ncbi:MAG TPA: SMP-30/gluconolactonase/LRE family protein [Puia sp.]|jgi:gluconolactonase
MSIRYFLYLGVFALCFGSCNNASETGRQTAENKADSVTPKKTARRIVILDPEALTILDSSALIEVIASGFQWAEGPLYVRDGNYLLFSDVPANRIYKWQEGKDTSVFLDHSGTAGPIRDPKEPGSNGLVLNNQGQLVLCQQGDRRMAKMTAPLSDPKPQFIPLAAAYQGKRLNSPNDAVYHPNGNLYFTDPPYGFSKGIRDSAKQLPFQGVFCLKPDGRLLLLTDELSYPNGIALSPDGKYLFVSNSDDRNKLWMKYELDRNGLIKSRQVFYHATEYDGRDLGNPDGMKINKKGYLFAAGPEGIWLFNPSGKLIAKILTGELTSNCAFSSGEKELFMTCNHYIMRCRLRG